MKEIETIHAEGHVICHDITCLLYTLTLPTILRV